jgi:hypothetical protein
LVIPIPGHTHLLVYPSKTLLELEIRNAEGECVVSSYVPLCQAGSGRIPERV